MNTKKMIAGMVLMGGLLLAFAASARADMAEYTWSDKLGRGVLNMVGSPVELARTIHIESAGKGPAYGWTMGIVEGMGKTLVRFGAGAIDTLTCPFNFPSEDKAPLLKPVYPWDDWDAPSARR